MRYAAALAIGLLVSPSSGLCQTPKGHHTTVIYFVRHGEVDPTLPTFPLSEAGTRRARAFARTVGSVQFTHVFNRREPLCEGEYLCFLPHQHLFSWWRGSVVDSDSQRSGLTTSADRASIPGGSIGFEKQAFVTAGQAPAAGGASARRQTPGS